MSVGHEGLLLVGDALCHWVGEVDSDYKSKGVLRMLGYLMGQSTTTKVGVLIDVLLQNRKSDARQKLEDMEEFALVAVAPGGELYWER